MSDLCIGAGGSLPHLLHARNPSHHAAPHTPLLHVAHDPHYAAHVPFFPPTTPHAAAAAAAAGGNNALPQTPQRRCRTPLLSSSSSSSAFSLLPQPATVLRAPPTTAFATPAPSAHQLSPTKSSPRRTASPSKEKRLPFLTRDSNTKAWDTKGRLEDVEYLYGELKEKLDGTVREKKGLEETADIYKSRGMLTFPFLLPFPLLFLSFSFSLSHRLGVGGMIGKRKEGRKEGRKEEAFLKTFENKIGKKNS
jgi:hypothetical protein